jgi:hypothetical protein
VLNVPAAMPLVLEAVKAPPMLAKSVMTPSVLNRLIQPSTSSETMFGIGPGSLDAH